MGDCFSLLYYVLNLCLFKIYKYWLIVGSGKEEIKETCKKKVKWNCLNLE